MTDSPIAAKLDELNEAILCLIEAADNEDTCDVEVAEAQKNCHRLARELAKVVRKVTREEAFQRCNPQTAGGCGCGSRVDAMPLEEVEE